LPKDKVKAWLAPLLVEAQERGIDLQPETEAATETREGQPYGPMNWLLFGGLVIKRLGIEGSYPPAPLSDNTPPGDYERIAKRATQVNRYRQVYQDFINRY
jgi:hypothetical protein